jgi:hypothetical protein
VVIVLVSADIVSSQVCNICMFAIGLYLGCVVLINGIVTTGKNYVDPTFTLGGWAIAPFEVGITCDRLNFN